MGSYLQIVSLKIEGICYQEYLKTEEMGNLYSSKKATPVEIEEKLNSSLNTSLDVDVKELVLNKSLDIEPEKEKSPAKSLKKSLEVVGEVDVVGDLDLVTDSKWDDLVADEGWDNVRTFTVLLLMAHFIYYCNA